ncbi:MAG: DUF1553 domain-containing protein [Planctomycetota bacterium]|nr:MAG: DUF1553 domain-containing protein [Planctomycetota bacterium]
MFPLAHGSSTTFGVWLSGIMLGLGVTLLSAAELQVQPPAIQIHDAFSRVQVLVTLDGRDVTRSAAYESGNAQIVTVDATGLVQPASAGSSHLLVQAGGQSVQIPIQITAFDQARQIDFITEVEPLLTRYGCNAGGCHGKATGQNGFKLSLFGFDGVFDHHAIATEARGRRISRSSARGSLLLRKATALSPHGGGKRFAVDSEPYNILLAWVESGAPASAPEVPRVQKIRIEPRERLLAPEARQQLRVVATYSNGTERDVTRQAGYASNLEVVARVDEQGLVTANASSGEAAIMARYMGQVAVFTAIRPHGNPLASIPDFLPINAIDHLATEKWKKLGILPSPACDDPTFLRRVTVDLCGRLPSVEESRTFLASTDPQKRQQLIDRLLDSPDYAAFFAMRWGTILRNSQLAGSNKAAYAFHNWIKEAIGKNRPYSEFVRGIVAASGEWQDAPAINWYWQSRDDQLHTATADTAQLFLGIRLQCARCHHHPYERWGQEDYFGLAGFYTRLGRKSFGEPPPYFSSPTPTTGEKNPLTDKVPEPKYPDGEYVQFTSEDDPRHALVDWMIQPENPYFARAYVNRMWGHFFGRGLVSEVDDMRETNPASNPEILDALALEFRHSGFDMKGIIRTMVSSRLYQLSSEPRPENSQDRQNFARYYARRMIAEVFLDAVDQTCGTKSNFSNMGANARAVDLPHEGFGSTFLDTFDRPQRVSVCECERSAAATLGQVLLLSNSDEVENKIADGNGRAKKLVDAQRSPAEIVEEIYLAAYSRPPRPDERTSASSYIEVATDRNKAVQDLVWAILNSREFMYNH